MNTPVSAYGQDAMFFSVFGNDIIALPGNLAFLRGKQRSTRVYE